MPGRFLREGIIDSERVDALSFAEEVFYRRLMSAVDDFGRFDGRPAVLKSRLYPLRADKVREADISCWIAACEKAGLIALYHVAGKQYVLFHGLGEARAKTSRFPAPPAGFEARFADARTCTQTRAHAPSYGPDNDNDNGNASDSPEPAKPPASGPASPTPTEKPLLTFPTAGKPVEWNLLPSQVAEWQTLFPQLGIAAECRKALAWVKAAPDRRKTARGMPRFLVGWFGRSNDRGGGKGGPAFGKAAAEIDNAARHAADAFGDHP